MDRPEPGLVKWSPNPSHDSFVHINLQHRVVQLYEPTGYARKGSFDYERLSRHDDFPPLTTYDWSSQNPGLLAVGTGTGVVNMLKINDGSNAYVELGLKMTRTCQAVGFNSTGLLAVGLDRVRMDQSLHIWDINRLSSTGTSSKGFPRDLEGVTEPKYRLEPSVSVSSLKFFEDSPQTLVVGIKGQDSSAALTFQTKCNNNLAIDFADQNYFASSALDVPTVLVWDKRATSRPVASTSYLQAVDEDDVPWGATLCLDKAIETDSDPSVAEGKHSLIRALRYCRDRRGLLGVLSRTGQLRSLQTNRETPSSDTASHDGPELLHVHKSHELDMSYRNTTRRNDRIVSFDWVNVGSPGLRPRALVLRANGSFDILEEPSSVSDHVFKLVPWQTPHRGLQEEDTPYHTAMQFEPAQASEMLAPLLIEGALDNAPIFGKDKPDLQIVAANAIKTETPITELINRSDEGIKTLPDSFLKVSSVGVKLRALRQFVRSQQTAADANGATPTTAEVEDLTAQTSDISLASNLSASCREMHEGLLGSLVTTAGLPEEAHNVIDHSMLLRAKERYLFDPVINRDIVCDDPWVRFAWDWVADAEDAADDGGMILSNLNLSYVGVQSIWNNDLGRNPNARLTPGSSPPDAAQWERYLSNYCKKKRIPKYDGVSTKRPHHRQLCLEFCRWGDAQKHDPQGLNRAEDPEFPTAIHTLAASRALFRGDTKQAVEILKKASAAHPELLFVSLALQLMGRAGKQAARERLELDAAVASKTDPYLQAISCLIATGDWTLIANQRSLPLADRAYVAVRNFNDDQLTTWINEQVTLAVAEGDIEGIVLTGITDRLVDIFARYIQKFHDVQTAILVLSFCYPRYIDDIRCRAWRKAYRAHLQRHKLFFERTKFEAESTKLSKRDGVPTLKPPSRQIALRCVYCDAETSLSRHHHQQQQQPAGSFSSSAAAPPPPPPPTISNAMETRNPLLATSISAGVSCPNCGRHLPRCVVCLEVVGVPRSDRPEEKDETRMAGRFPTFCLRCEHVLHLDHARQWFARHAECPVPECRCRCNFRANPELHYR